MQAAKMYSYVFMSVSSTRNACFWGKITLMLEAPNQCPQPNAKGIFKKWRLVYVKRSLLQRGLTMARAVYSKMQYLPCKTPTLGKAQRQARSQLRPWPQPRPATATATTKPSLRQPQPKPPPPPAPSLQKNSPRLREMTLSTKTCCFVYVKRQLSKSVFSDAWYKAGMCRQPKCF